MCSPTTSTPWRSVRCRLLAGLSRSRFRWPTSAMSATARSPSSGPQQPTRRRASTSGPEQGGGRHSAPGPDPGPGLDANRHARPGAQIPRSWALAGTEREAQLRQTDALSAVVAARRSLSMITKVVQNRIIWASMPSRRHHPGPATMGQGSSGARLLSVSVLLLAPARIAACSVHGQRPGAGRRLAPKIILLLRCLRRCADARRVRRVAILAIDAGRRWSKNDCQPAPVVKKAGKCVVMPEGFAP
jgi:hypothetical protein